MKPARIALILTVAVLSLLPAAAQIDDGDSRVTAELAGIRQALDRLVELQSSDQRYKQIDLMLRRIEIEERRLEPLGQKLRSAEGDVEGITRELASLEAMTEQQEDYLDQEVREGIDTPDSDTRRMLDDLERTVKQLRDRLQDAEFQVREAENAVAQRRDEIEFLDDELQQLFEALGRKTRPPTQSSEP